MKVGLLTVPRRYFFCGSFVFLCVVFLMLLRLFVNCSERADLLALVGDVYYIFVTFPCGILSQVWYLIVSIPDLCTLTYFAYLPEECTASNFHAF